MTQFHINPETLRTNKCSAQIKCKFKGSQHFDNESDARAYRDEMMTDHSIPAVLKKSSPSSSAMVSSALTALKSVGVAEPETAALMKDGARLTKNERAMVQELEKMAEASKTGKISDTLLAKASGYHFAKELLTGKERLMLQDMELLTKKQFEADERARKLYKKTPVVPTKIELDQELHDVEPELYGYGVAELLADRGYDHVDVATLEKRGFHSLTLKVTGYYEVDISTDLARRELGMPARTPTVKDETPLRQAEIAMLEARRNSTGMFESIDAAKAAERAYREAADKFRLLKKEDRNN